jgi:glutamine amidotransferase
MRPKVTIVNYGLGNLFSIANALEHCGGDVRVTDNPREVTRADRIVLPGVGAFSDGMDGLRKRSLVDPIKEFVLSGRPLLGICLGMQIMFDVSEEFGEHKGLGFISGRVVLIPDASIDGTPHKIPHIGWNGIEPSSGSDRWGGTILRNIPHETSFYFVHSFTAVPENEEHRLADTFYNGRRLLAVIKKGNLCGSQFHPEKSGEKGLRILGNFIML